MLRGEWISTEITHRKKDGTIFPVAVSAGLLELGDHKYILAFDRDVTARKHAEEALQRAEQLKVVGDLATGLTHELKNSLAGIKISIEVLLDELALSEDDRNVLSGMINEIRRIEILIKDLLNFARPSKPHVAFIDINSILDTAMVFSLKNVKRSADGETPVNVVKEFDRHLPKTVADPMQLQQVFMNLLLNAVEAMPKGGLLRVKTSHEAKTNMISVSIADTGKGVDKEVLDRIFEPFFTTKPKGTGLGLPITKRLVEQNGGDIHVELNAEKGTTFRISLPVKQFEEAGVA
jgi:two-component system sensor histidine kinase AtoS